MTGGGMVTIPAWVARATLTLVEAELARVRVMARADVRWAPEALRLESAAIEQQRVLSDGR